MPGNNQHQRAAAQIIDTKTELYFSWKIIFETKAKYENKNTWTTGVIYNQSKTTNFVVLLQSASV